MGLATYAIVLSYPAKSLLRDQIGGAADAGLFLVTIVLAWLLHTLVELPMMKHFSRSRRDRAESAAAAGPAPEPAAADQPAELERHAA